MIKSYFCKTTVVAALTFVSFQGVAQSVDSLKTYTLDELRVSAYASTKNTLENTASIGLLTPQVFQKYAPTFWTHAVNTLPGVRMEERSPGSYRFSVRGSMMRSPFGIRNVKFYLNHIPFTDVHGNTPLNVLDFNSVQSMEVIKGPGSSLYGANTGGVVLLQSNPTADKYIEQQMGIGKYGLQSRSTDINLNNIRIQYGHLEQEGYRNQSQLYRDVLSISTRHTVGKKGTLSLMGIYSDLYYQTPGGINLAQMQADPTQARQPAGALPGSETQNARITTQYSLFGASYELKLSPSWTQINSVALTTNTFANPFISNYEKREENGFNTRNTWQYRTALGKWQMAWTSGIEFQKGRSAQRNYDNLQGDPGPQQTSEDIGTRQGSVFTQVEASLPQDLTVTGGLGYSFLKYQHENFFPGDYARTDKSFEGMLMPRLAINKVLAERFSITGSVSKGFSPPTLQEVRPSAGGFRPDLAAETGVNYELVARYIGSRLVAEVTGYSFGLRNTIVRRTNEAGSEYFINAGKTQQNGIEWNLSYPIFFSKAFVNQLRGWHSGTYTHYEFQDVLSGETNLTGNKLPGVPKFLQNTGVDVFTKVGINAHITYQTSSKFYLNDLNTVENTPYQLLHIRMAWRKQWSKALYSELSSSAEWVNADMYSLGYDLNAFGNRYYNPAAKQTWHANLKLGWRFK